MFSRVSGFEQFLARECALERGVHFHRLEFRDGLGLPLGLLGFHAASLGLNCSTTPPLVGDLEALCEELRRLDGLHPDEVDEPDERGVVERVRELPGAQVPWTLARGVEASTCRGVMRVDGPG